MINKASVQKYLLDNYPDADGTLAKKRMKNFCHRRGRSGWSRGVSKACCDHR
jgi:hypothetical protein